MYYREMENRVQSPTGKTSRRIITVIAEMPSLVETRGHLQILENELI